MVVVTVVDVTNWPTGTVVDVVDGVILLASFVGELGVGSVTAAVSKWVR